MERPMVRLNAGQKIVVDGEQDVKPAKKQNTSRRRINLNALQVGYLNERVKQGIQISVLFRETFGFQTSETAV